MELISFSLLFFSLLQGPNPSMLWHLCSMESTLEHLILFIQPTPWHVYNPLLLAVMFRFILLRSHLLHSVELHLAAVKMKENIYGNSCYLHPLS